MNSDNQVFDKIISGLKSPYFFLTWTMLAALSYFVVDQRLALYMHESLNPLLLEIAQSVTLLGNGTYYLIGLFLLFLFALFWRKNPQLTRGALFLFLAILISGLLCDVVKIICGRARPLLLFNDHLYGFYFWQTKYPLLSFPSGHATTITALMLALSLLFPRYWIGFFVTFLLVSFSRVMVTAHYLSDVMIGMYLGALVVIWVYQWQNLRQMR